MGWFLFHIFGCKGIKKNVYGKVFWCKYIYTGQQVCGCFIAK